MATPSDQTARKSRQAKNQKRSGKTGAGQNPAHFAPQGGPRAAAKPAPNINLTEEPRLHQTRSDAEQPRSAPNPFNTQQIMDTFGGLNGFRQRTRKLAMTVERSPQGTTYRIVDNLWTYELHDDALGGEEASVTVSASDLRTALREQKTCGSSESIAAQVPRIEKKSLEIGDHVLKPKDLPGYTPRSDRWIPRGTRIGVDDPKMSLWADGCEPPNCAEIKAWADRMSTAIPTLKEAEKDPRGHHDPENWAFRGVYIPKANSPFRGCAIATEGHVLHMTKAPGNGFNKETVAETLNVLTSRNPNRCPQLVPMETIQKAIDAAGRTLSEAEMRTTPIDISIGGKDLNKISVSIGRVTVSSPMIEGFHPNVEAYLTEALARDEINVGNIENPEATLDTLKSIIKNNEGLKKHKQDLIVAIYPHQNMGKIFVNSSNNKKDKDGFHPDPVQFKLNPSQPDLPQKTCTQDSRKQPITFQYDYFTKTLAGHGANPIQVSSESDEDGNPDLLGHQWFITPSVKNHTIENPQQTISICMPIRVDAG